MLEIVTAEPGWGPLANPLSTLVAVQETVVTELRAHEQGLLGATAAAAR